MVEMNVEDVFKKSGLPTVTFVEPIDFTKLVVALRAKGRSVVVEGPSGIGKTTAVLKALERAQISESFERFSGRKGRDQKRIKEIFSEGAKGNILVDDFHKLDDSTKEIISNELKVLADEERDDTSVVIIGINDCGKSIIKFADDVTNRLDFFRFEVNPDHKIFELINGGEKALNIDIDTKDEIVQECQGSFYLAQMLCYELCVKAGITETLGELGKVSISFEQVKAAVWKDLSQKFGDRCAEFCRGPKFRPSGRAPYLHVLNWLATSRDWSLNVKERLRSELGMKGSVGQVVDKGFMARHIAANSKLDELLHFDQNSSQLTIEDPQFIFFIRNIAWNTFSKNLGFRGLDFSRRYDFALSFSGSSRTWADKLANAMREDELEVFYDRHEQERILAEDVEDYLEPIYKSEAYFVICLLDDDYPSRVWTRFESQAFKDRFGLGQVIPVLIGNTKLGLFSAIEKIGHHRLSEQREIRDFVALCKRKLDEVPVG